MICYNIATNFSVIRDIFQSVALYPNKNMPKLIIKNATIVNENQIFESDLEIENQRIVQIENHISVNQNDLVYDAQGLLLLPGMIDDQVHFREPGLTHKGTIASESRAAVAGGITSYMEMPNVNPSTTTIAALKEKHTIAKQTSLANYSFYLTPDLLKRRPLNSSLCQLNQGMACLSLSNKPPNRRAY